MYNVYLYIYMYKYIQHNMIGRQIDGKSIYLESVVHTTNVEEIGKEEREL